jgi:DNA-binding SARP family transcriptional activator
MLHVRVLGPVEVARDGVVLDLGGPQQRAVVAHLAVEAGRVVSVERLIDRLWGDEPPRTPLGTLQSYVSRLRRALEPARAAGAPPQVLVSEAPGYTLRIDPDAIDVHRFTSLSTTGRSAAAGGDFRAAVEAFDEALALWRGEPLAGIGPDEQVRPIVVRLVEERSGVVEDRFDALLALGRHGEIVAALQTAVDEQPLRERLWSQLAIALYRNSRQADALRALSNARNTLLDELGLDPGPELRELEQRILAQDPSLLATPRVEAPVAATAHVERRRTADLVGREQEWRIATRALDEAQRGGVLLLVEGEPGIGKSTLCEALLARATTEGWATAVGRCVDTGLAPSLWPAIEIMRTILAHPATADLDARLAERLRHLNRGGDDGSIATPIELTDAFIALLDALPGTRWVILLDDLHWADRATLDVLELVVARLGTRPVLVVGAHRPPELAPGTLLGAALGDLGRGAERIVMSPLGDDDVARLIELTSGTAPSTEIAARVAERAGGNPLFVTELARLAGERGFDDPADVPTAIRDVVRSRLAPLPENTTAELQVAAVLGERFDLHLAMAASDRDPDACLDALDAAIVTRVLVPDGDSYRFAHALVRDAVLAGVTNLRLARIHQRAADAIIQVRGDGPDEVEPIAFHRLASASITPAHIVGKALVRASDIARWRNSFDQALSLAQTALDLLARAPRTPEVRSVEIEALESVISLEYRRAERTHHELAQLADELAERTGSDSARAMALFLRWNDIDTIDDLDDVTADIERATELAERTTEPYALVIAHYMIGSYALLRGRIDEALSHVAISVEAAGSADPDNAPEHVPLVMTPVVGAIAAAAAGRSDEARTHAYRRAASWLSERSTVDPTTASALTFTNVMVEALLDQPSRVRELLTDVEFTSDGAFFDQQHAAFSVLQAWAGARLGHPAAADEVAAAAIDDLHAAPDRVLRPCITSFHAQALMLVDDAASAHWIARSREEAERSGEVWWLSETIRLQALIERRFGDPSRFEPLLDEAEAIARDHGAAGVLERIVATRADALD